MKKHTALKQSVKNDTCIEFRRNIQALTLLADTTSGNLFHSWTARTEEILTNNNSGIRINSVAEKKWGYRLIMAIILSNLKRFQNSFHWKIPW